MGPAEGLFNRAFYAQCQRALAADGMLVQQTESPLLHLELIRSVQDSLRAEGFAATQLLHFPQPVYPSGWWSATLARKSAAEPQAVAARVAELASQTRYFNPGTLQGALAMPNFVRAALSEN